MGQEALLGLGPDGSDGTWYNRRTRAAPWCNSIAESKILGLEPVIRHQQLVLPGRAVTRCKQPRVCFARIEMLQGTERRGRAGETHP